MGLTRVFPLTFLSLSIALLSSCVSGPKVPDWVERYPSESRYYIGIGSSESSVQAVAADQARREALANLAASISTTIVSEVETETGVAADGATFQSVKQRIQEKVYQTIEGAQVVDSYFSPQTGYWIYLRFPKEELERQKRDLSRRVEEAAAPVFASDGMTVAESLALLQKAHRMLLDSPFFANLRGNLDGKDRILIDVLEEKTASELTGLSVGHDPEVIEGTAGDNVGLTLNLAAATSPGNLPVAVSFGSEALLSGRLDDEGNFSGGVDLARLPLGRGILTAGLDLEELGIKRGDYLQPLPVPSQGIPFVVRPLPVGLTVEYDKNLKVEGITAMTAALFSASGLPFSLVPEDPAPAYRLRCRLIVEDFPRFKENSLEISQARLIIQVEGKGEILYSYESGPMKDGGLTLAQAHERTIKKLFAKLKNEQPYLQGVIDALPIRIQP